MALRTGSIPARRGLINRWSYIGTASGYMAAYCRHTARRSRK
nr:MAG TPA: apolipoprotein [Caudoviricetes sp.]